jgi:hypothetical protein
LFTFLGVLDQMRKIGYAGFETGFLNLRPQYQLHDQRQNPDTVSAIVQYDGWNLNFESSVLPIRNDHPSVFLKGQKARSTSLVMAIR